MGGSRLLIPWVIITDPKGGGYHGALSHGVDHDHWEYDKAMEKRRCHGQGKNLMLMLISVNNC